MPAANIGSQSMRVSEGLQVQFTLAGFVPVDKDALRIPRTVSSRKRYGQFPPRKNFR
jgi:hypothetical protein